MNKYKCIYPRACNSADCECSSMKKYVRNIYGKLWCSSSVQSFTANPSETVRAVFSTNDVTQTNQPHNCMVSPMWAHPTPTSNFVCRGITRRLYMDEIWQSMEPQQNLTSSSSKSSSSKPEFGSAPSSFSPVKGFGGAGALRFFLSRLRTMEGSMLFCSAACKLISLSSNLINYQQQTVAD